MANGSDDPARLLIVRHGQIEANLRRIWHGSTDSGLTELGRQQAQRAAERLAAHRPAPTAVYASPLERCRSTALTIAEPLGLEVRPEPALVEYGIGELEGVSYQALLDDGFFRRMHADPAYAPPGGESREAVTERVSGALARIAREHRGESVVAVGHGAAIGLALAWLLQGDATEWQRYHLHNGSVSELVLEPVPRLLSFDDTEHLQD